MGGTANWNDLHTRRERRRTAAARASLPLPPPGAGIVATADAETRRGLAVRQVRGASRALDNSAGGARYAGSGHTKSGRRPSWTGRPSSGLGTPVAGS